MKLYSTSAIKETHEIERPLKFKGLQKLKQTEGNKGPWGRGTGVGGPSVYVLLSLDNE